MGCAYEEETDRHFIDCCCDWLERGFLDTLPEVVAVQVGFDGKVSNTMPKVLAVAIPFGVSVVGSVMHLTGKEEKIGKGFILSVAGIAIMVLSLLINR